MTCPSELTPYVASDIVEQVSFKLAGPIRVLELMADDDIEKADLFYMIAGILEDQVSRLDDLSISLMQAQALMQRANSK
jgi:methionine synthase II (cobalamin-independent)